MKKISGKDIFAIILCLAAYVLLVFVTEFLGFVSPLLWVGVSVIAAFFGAFPMTYLMARVQKPWIALGTAVLWALFMLTSSAVWDTVMVVYPLLVGIAAEVAHKQLRYNTILGLRICYAILSLITFAQMLSLWTNTDTYVSIAVEEMGSEAYGDALRSYANVGALLLILALTMAVGFVGTYAAGAVLKKPLKKYGLQ